MDGDEKVKTTEVLPHIHAAHTPTCAVKNRMELLMKELREMKKKFRNYLFV